jgi:DNA-binding helix-hairpin-helix protein with protein kinase domain
VKSAILVDSHGRPIALGRQIGRGGEGSVYEVEGEPSLVVKVYHQMPLPADQVAKLQALVARWSHALEAISAWPRALVFEGRGRQPCGIVMPHVRDGRHLHELYGTTNRRRYFPEALWHHLVLAARNTAAAFHTLHAAGIVVGDVNQGNLMVDPQMCVRLIDCDSFQITSGERTYACPVGTPHFTPPELQSQRLRDVWRTADHDAFGMAVLIFHLLFVGRHPFAGRYRGAGELPIAKAIAERRFAFSQDRVATQVDPPPASLTLDDLPEGLARLFEAAFRGGDSGETPRPRPLEWVGQLEKLMTSRAKCGFDRLHFYYRGLSACPWCRIEEEGGPAFFVPADGVSVVSTDRLAHFDCQITELRPARFPDLPPQRLALPQMPPLKRPAKGAKWSWSDAAVAGLATAAVLCVVGIALWPAFWAGAAMSIASGLALLWSTEASARRKRVVDLQATLEQLLGRLEQLGRGITREYQKRAKMFAKARDALKTAREHYQADDAELQDVILQQRDAQKNAYLRSYLIREQAGAISGLKASQLSMLESFGIESAFDVDNLSLCAVPSISSSLAIELLQWRSQLENEFEFRPEHGVTAQELQFAGEAAARRFKLGQARKVLMGAKQVAALANAGEIELGQFLARYDAEVSKWRGIAGELRDFQSGRRRWERLVNRTRATIVAPAAGIPLFGLVLRLLFG